MSIGKNKRKAFSHAVSWLTGAMFLCAQTAAWSQVASAGGTDPLTGPAQPPSADNPNPAATQSPPNHLRVPRPSPAPQKTGDQPPAVQGKELLGKDSQGKVSQVKDSQVKVSQVKDSQVKDSQGKVSQVKDSQVKDSQVKDSQVKDSQVKDSQVKDSQGKDSQSRVSQNKEARSKGKYVPAESSTKNSAPAASKEPAPTLSGLTPKMDPNTGSPTSSTTAGAGKALPYSAPPSEGNWDPFGTEATPASPGAPPVVAPAPAQPAASTPAGPLSDSYPTVGKMESMVFGAAQPAVTIENRLSKLETAVFKQSYPQESLFDRSERLKGTLLGATASAPPPDGLTMPDSAGMPRFPDLDTSLPLASAANAANAAVGPAQEFLEEVATAPENQAEVGRQEQERFALELINGERNKLAMGALTYQPDAVGMAQEQVASLCRRGVLSHADEKGNNPDRRYTLAGGSGALSESLVSVSTADTGNRKRSRAAVALMLKALMGRQDDREALMAPEATQFGFACDFSKDGQKLIGCFETVTNHGIISPLPNSVRVGEKVEVKGLVTQPFKFEKVTMAWEGSKSMAAAADESQEALPYFPPLDYVAYANKSEHDYSTALAVARTVGVVAAIAGGMFMPPVALAAPLIAMSGGMNGSEPKPVSDIPIHSGMHSDGSAFDGKIPVGKDGQEGTYYITVWASLGKGTKAVPISRRAIIATQDSETVSAAVEEEPPKHDKKHKKSDGD